MLCDAVAIQSSAEPLRSLAHLSLLVHRPCFTSPTPASPLRFCARRLFTLPFHRASIHLNAIAKQCFASRSFALAFLCAATLYFAFLCYTLPDRTLPRLRYALLNPTLPLLFWAHRGDSFRYPAIACHCFSILRLHYAKHLPAAPFQHYVSLHFSIALPRYASPRKASAVLLVPKQNSAYPMQFLAVRRSASPLLSLPCITPPFLASHHSALPLLC